MNMQIYWDRRNVDSVRPGGLYPELGEVNCTYWPSISIKGGSF